MLLCNYELTPTLKLSLAHPSAANTAATAAVSPATPTSAAVIVATVLIVIAHLMPLLRAPLPASGRRAWRVVVTLLALAAIHPEEVNVATLYL